MKSLLADTLGTLLASKANITEQADAVKADLIDLSAQRNERVFEGELFRATVSFGTKTVVDYKAVLQALSYHVQQRVIDELVKEHTRTAEGVPTVRCTARKA